MKSLELEKVACMSDWGVAPKVECDCCNTEFELDGAWWIIDCGAEKILRFCSEECGQKVLDTLTRNKR